MSDLSQKIRTALFVKLAVSNVTSLATGGVHYRVAPANTNRPFLVFDRQSPGLVNYNFGFTRTHEDDLWQIRAVTDEDSSVAKSPQSLGEEILNAAITAIGLNLTLPDAVTWAVLRVRDIPNYTEKVSDRIVFHQGFLLRVVAAPV